MGLRDVVRKAEEQSLHFARRGASAARESWNDLDDVQRRIRQKMRLWPSRTGDTAASARKAIISVNGEDVEPSEMPGGRKIA